MIVLNYFTCERHTKKKLFSKAWYLHANCQISLRISKLLYFGKNRNCRESVTNCRELTDLGDVTVFWLFFLRIHSRFQTTASAFCRNVHPLINICQLYFALVITKVLRKFKSWFNLSHIFFLYEHNKNKMFLTRCSCYTAWSSKSLTIPWLT